MIMLRSKTADINKDPPIVSLTTDGQDGNGLQLINVELTLSILLLCLAKHCQNLYWFAVLAKVHVYTPGKSCTKLNVWGNF